MKQLLISILILVATTGLAQNSKYAVIEVRVDSASGQTLYLTRYRGPMLDNVMIDSTRLNSESVYHLAVEPDPNTHYELLLGDGVVAYHVFLAAGDSLVYLDRYHQEDTLIYDRIGANRVFLDPSTQPRSQMHFYQTMGDLDADALRAYVARFKTSMMRTADRLQSMYSDHPAMINGIRSAAIRWYFEPQLQTLIHHYDEKEYRPNLDPHFGVIDSIPWSAPEFRQSEEMEYLVTTWTELSGLRWWRAGIDTSIKKYQTKLFEFARSLPSPAREVAWVNIASDISGGGSPVEISPILEHEFEQHRLEMDTAYNVLFEKQVEKVRAKLPGKSAPAFLLPDSTKRMVSLSDFRGKVVYLDFWGTWCHPCVEEIPSLIELEKKFEGDTSVAFVSISIEYEAWNRWKKFLHDRSLKGTQLYAERQFNNEVAQAYGIQGVPTFMIIGPDGKFIDAGAPRPSSGQAEAAIRAAMAKGAN
jgi:thiol-disulfide isomerase/thioredoxin